MFSKKARNFYLWKYFMAYNKKGKNPKHIDHDEKKIPEASSDKKNVSAAFLNELKGAFDNFAKISDESKRIELYGNKEYLEQFREYFKQEYPNLLDKIDKKDLPIYIQTIEKEGFSIANITKNTSKLHEEFKSEDTEIHVMEKSLSELKKFCENKSNNIPDGTFRKFATAAEFTQDTLVISPDGNLKTIDSLHLAWKNFLEKEKIELGATSAEQAERILTPNYNPTERIMVTVALTKIRKELKGSLKTAFDAQFPLPLTVFSTYQDLINFKTQFIQFLDDHAAEIDEGLAKKLDSIIVTNGDIKRELFESGRKFDDTRGFSEREQYFRRIFNKLATRQLFEEVKKTQDTIDHYVGVMGDAFKQFPPYVNDILNIYPFNAKAIAVVDPSFEADMLHRENQINDLNTQYAVANDIERKELRKKMKALKEEMEYRRRQAYIVFLRTKDINLANVFAQLVSSKFNFSTLSAEQQQLIVDVLIKHKLEDTIKNKVPELLSVKEEDIAQFVHDLFDLKKMDLTIRTKQGPVSLTFLKKEFLASTRKHLPGLTDLAGDIKNLPLNFLTQLTESNAAFFEESPIFDSIYTDFKAKNGNFRFNDAYKVKIKKDGKMVEGYLSSYCPINEKYNDKEYDGKELFLYSEPITAPNQEREIVTRPHEEGKTSIPVVIKEAEQQECDMEILDRKLNLNGDAFGALLFGYVLGQQSMNTTISSAQEKALAEKFGSLDVYKEKEEGEEEEIEPVVEQNDESKIERSEHQKFLDEWKQFKGYSFSEEKYKSNHGFVEGTRLFIPFASSEVPPEGSGNTWVQMEITHIDEKKGTFKIKMHGGELHLGKAEGVTKEMPLTPASIESIRKAFGSGIYKLPDTKGMKFDQQMDILTKGSAASDLEKYFGSLKFDGSKFVYNLGDYIDKEVTHFGIYEPKAINEDLDTESGKNILYKIKSNPNHTITVSGDSMKNNYAKNFPERDMDYATFILFVKEKGLQPKCKEQLKAIDVQAKQDEEVPTTVRGFSMDNVISFFKNGANKIKDSVKKYDEERAEDLTDILTNQGKLRNNIGGILSPFSKISSSFESMGAEYHLERDTRIRKKIDKWAKFYEDFDYTELYTEVIGPMLTGKIKIVPHYKVAAILLVHLKKGKGPYAKHLPVVDGKWIGMLLGKDHQERYLAIREKKIRDLEQNAHLYPIAWADDIKDELVELEMRYIVHVMDGRQMGMGDDVKYFFQDKYSKKFCDELEGAYTGFFKHSTVEEGLTKAKDANFEFARVEYFRQLADRPQQALPYLKVMAMKAINDTQWQVFEAAVLAGVLSGVFLNMTYSTTQEYIQKICRTRGFIPGIFAKDINQQSKIQRLLDLFSDKSFSEKTHYSSSDYSLRNNKGSKDFLDQSFKPGGSAFLDWIESKDKKTGFPIREELSKFLKMEGPNTDGKTLLDLYSDPTTSISDKALLEEYINKTNEKDEALDSDIEKNTSSLTGSILTKSQSVVEKMTKFNNGLFAGANGDEIQNMKAFSKNMQTAIPKDILNSQEQVKFFVGKFFNWFGESGFTGSKLTEFLKRLKRCKQNKGSPMVKDVLFYSIVGEIISSPPHNAMPPIELQGALGAWQTFFEQNLDNILQPDVITSCFGGSQYKADYDKSQAQLEPRETASIILDKEDSNMYMYSLPTKELKAQFTTKKRELGNENKYLNNKLYQLAADLYRRCGYTNLFKKDVNQYKKSLTKSTAKATGAKIKNANETIEKVRQILEGKQIDENESDEYIPMEDDMYENY